MPGARDSYINLGSYYDDNRLEKRRTELTELNSRYKHSYRTAYKYLRAAGELAEVSAANSSDKAIKQAVENCISLLPKAEHTGGMSRHFFLDTFSRSGNISLLNTLTDWRVYNITADPHDGSNILNILGSSAEASVHSPVYCPSPLDPGMILHLLFPSLKTAFTLFRTENSSCAAALTCSRPDRVLEQKQQSLLTTASENLNSAGHIHDMLEEIYNPCVDFSGIYSLAEKHINTIL